jgi:hypothetical protein
LGGLAELPLIGFGTEAASRAAETPRGQSTPEEDYHAPEWLRYARVVYFEGYGPPIYPHIRDFDAKRLVEIVLELGGDTLRFQPIGFRAYYLSKVFPVHPELGNRDLIDEVSRECHQAGIHQYCYCVYCNTMDATVISDPRYAGWVLRDIDGKPYGEDTAYGNAKEIKVCATGDIYREAIRKVVRELSEHDIDGIYFDAPSGYKGICFCGTCKKNFRKFSGMDLDRLRNVRDLNRLPSVVDMNALGAWYDWANKLTEEDLRDLRKIIHGSGKVMLCHNGDTWTPGALHLQYRFADGFMVEYSEQFYQRLVRAMLGASMARPTKKLAQMYMGSYDVSANWEPAHSKPWAAHIINLEDGDEIRMEGFANLAGGNMPVYLVANRLLYGIGDGTANPAKEVFALIRNAEAILKDSIPVSYVTIVPTVESLELWRTRRQSWNVMMSESFGLVMLDERIGFDVCASTEMSEEWLKSQRVIALCGASAVSVGDARRLADWVKKGGGLLATYDTGLYDEKGELRRDGGVMKEVLGVEMKGEPLEGQADCYYQVNSTHPALGQYRQGAVLMGDGRLVPVNARAGATVLATCLNLDTQESRGPAIVSNQFGRGRAVYIAGSLEAHYVSSRVPSLQRILGSIIRYLAADEPMLFSLTAPKGVYGALRQAPNGDPILWICANVGFKDAAVGRMRQEFVPISNVEVKIRLTEGKQVKSVHLVRADRSVPFTVSAGYAVMTIPTLHIAEVVHLKLA